jgi:hypothetical protein
MASRLNFDSLRKMHWDDASYDEVKQYLTDRSFSDKRSTTRQQRDFKAKADLFVLSDQGEIVLVVDEQPPWAKDPDSGNVVAPVKLPFRMQVVKESDVPKVIKKFYGDVQTNGYRGVAAFFDRLQKEFLGISRRDVEKTIATFEVKQVSTATNYTKVVKPIVTTHKMEHWEMDLIDVSQHSRLNGGITFLLNVVDHFSKFAWSRPLKNKSMENVSYELLHIFLQEGSPEVLTSDNGSEFVGSKTQELCANFNVDQRFSAAYRPQTNGLVERFNKTLKEGLARYLADHSSKRYIDELQYLVHSYNTTKHGTTRQTPFQVHKGVDASMSMLNLIVQERIQKKADQMVADSERASQGKLSPLAVGDTVRIDQQALRLMRKLSEIERKSKHITNWTKQLYTISLERLDPEQAEKLDPASESKQSLLMQYQVEPVPEGEKDSRWFFRHELQKVDAEALEKAKSISDKRDLNYGGGKFDLERHLVEMPRGDRRVAMMSEDALEQKESNDDQAAAAAGPAEPRRTGRAGAGFNAALYAGAPFVSH